MSKSDISHFVAKSGVGMFSHAGLGVSNPQRKRQTLSATDDFEDDDFKHITPEKILEDMRLSHHGGKGGKSFRAAHAMSMRRKLR